MPPPYHYLIILLLLLPPHAITPRVIIIIATHILISCHLPPSPHYQHNITLFITMSLLFHFIRTRHYTQYHWRFITYIVNIITIRHISHINIHSLPQYRHHHAPSPVITRHRNHAINTLINTNSLPSSRHRTTRHLPHVIINSLLLSSRHVKGHHHTPIATTTSRTSITYY